MNHSAFVEPGHVADLMIPPAETPVALAGHGRLALFAVQNQYEVTPYLIPLGQ
jgi:hypothetical protein